MVNDCPRTFAGYLLGKWGFLHILSLEHSEIQCWENKAIVFTLTLCSPLDCRCGDGGDDRGHDVHGGSVRIYYDHELHCQSLYRYHRYLNRSRQISWFVVYSAFI